MSGYEPDMSWAKCNCPWNPDSHAKDCPIYARNYIDTLRTANQQLEAEREAALTESRLLRTTVKALRSSLADLLGCPATVVSATVPKAGVAAAPPYQVVLDVSVSLTRWQLAGATLAHSYPTTNQKECVQPPM
jgi:hypothetical protein